MSFEFILSLFASSFRVSLPLIFAAYGGLLSERAGVINIALEGLMLVGAFSAAATASITHSAPLGLLVGALSGGLFALFYGLFVIRFHSDQIVAGTAINLLAAGIAPFIGKILFDSTGATPSLEMSERFVYFPIVLCLAVTLGIWLWDRYSISGLWFRVAGEHPVALESSGVSVLKVRWTAVFLSGVLAGLGGVTLSIYLSSGFSKNMTAGRGFMALAAMIFGKWKPLPTFIACLLFGLFDALQMRLQGIVLWGENPVPVQFVQIMPYIVTMVVLAGWIGKSSAPKALGLPYSRQ